jgi:hypothetical protein
MKTRYNYIVDIQNFIGVFFDRIKPLHFKKKLEFLGINGIKMPFFQVFNVVF